MIFRRALMLTLVLLAACGGDAAVTTTLPSATTTTVVATTTTSGATTGTTLAPDDKPEDSRVDGLALAGGFQGGETPTEVPETPTGTGYSGYQTIYDETQILTVDVPVEWADTFGGAWTENIFGIEGGPEGIGLAISASSDLDGWIETWTVPGLFFGASDQLTGTPSELLDYYSYLADECTYDARYEYDDGAYVGEIDWWDNCGGVGTAYAVIVARPPGEEFTVVVEITMVTEEDITAADTIINTYYVVMGDEEGAIAGGLDTELASNYGATDVVAGFEPDPQTMAMEAGGDVDVAAYLGSECFGFVTAQPDLEVTYSGSIGGLLRFFFLADVEGADTVMVINDPAGDWWCADDSYETFNPAVEFVPALDGVYDIWVGTYESGLLVPGSLYITELEEIHP